MKEKLIIKNFGPIKDIELDLGKVTVLIGEQATGKSTVAKVLAVCRYFSYIAPIGVEPDRVYVEGLADWGLFESLQTESYISYECDDYFVEFKTRPISGPDMHNDGVKKVEPYLYPTLIGKSLAFKSLLREFEQLRQEMVEDFTIFIPGIPTTFLLNEVKSVMDNPFYLPTQRGLQSIFDLGKSSIQNLSSALFNQLAKMDGIARLFKKETYIEPLDIYYVNRNGHGFIRKANEDKWYSLYNAASGYQTMIPIVLTVKYYAELKKKTKTLLIEEPELDVFPVTQNKLVQYLVEKSKAHNSMLFLTTHSPYTLTALNNLMYAYTVGKIDKKRANAVVEEKYWINPEDVSAYLLKTDGTFENIVDEEEGMIKAEKIDGVSSEINKTFDRLLTIEINEGTLDA